MLLLRQDNRLLRWDQLILVEALTGHMSEYMSGFESYMIPHLSCHFNWNTTRQIKPANTTLESQIYPTGHDRQGRIYDKTQTQYRQGGINRSVRFQ